MVDRVKFQGDARFTPPGTPDRTIAPTALANFAQNINANVTGRLNKLMAEKGQREGAKVASGKTKLEEPLPSANTVLGANFRDAALGAMAAELKNQVVESTNQVLIDHPADIESAGKQLEAVRGTLIKEAQPELQDVMLQQYDLAAGKIKQKIQINAFELAREEQRDSVELGIEQAINQINVAAFDGDEDGVIQFMDEAAQFIEMQVSNGHITSAEGVRRIQKIDRDSDSQLVFGQFNRARSEGQALEFLENFNETPPAGIDQEQFVALRQTMSAQLRADRSIENEKAALKDRQILEAFGPALRDLQLGVLSGEGDESMIENAGRLFQLDLLSPNEFVNMTNKIQDNIDKRVNMELVTNNIIRSFSGIPPTEPVDMTTKENKKILDDFYNTRIVPDVEALKDPVARQGIELLAKNMNALPETLERQLEGVRNASDPEVALGLSDMVNRLPINLQDKIPARDRAYMSELRKQRELNEPGVAMEKTQELMNVEPDVAARRLAIFKEQQGGDKKFRQQIDGELLDRIKGDDLRFPDGFDSDQLSDAMAVRYKNQVERYIKMGTTSMNAAMDEAYKDLTQIYASTRINGGEPEIMVRPPYTAAFEKEPEQMREVLVNDTVGAIEDGFTAIIKSDGKTLTSNPPQYQLWQRKEVDGEFVEERVLSPNGKQMSWIPPDNLLGIIQEKELKDAKVRAINEEAKEMQRIEAEVNRENATGRVFDLFPDARSRRMREAIQFKQSFEEQPGLPDKGKKQPTQAEIEETIRQFGGDPAATFRGTNVNINDLIDKKTK